MSGESDVAIALTDRLNKLLRETLRAVPQGDESLALLDSMYEGTRDGWVLYHNPSIKWYYEQDPVIGNIDTLVRSFTAEDEHQYEVTYFSIYSEIPDGYIDHVGGQEDPFGLGYTLKLQYDLQPKQEVTPCPPPKRRRATRSSASRSPSQPPKPLPKRRGRKRRSGR
jgi:hypothetical protein